VRLQIRFEQNIAEYQDHLDVPLSKLAALPASYVAALAPGDEPGTARVTLDYPSYFPFMEQVGDRELRRQLRHKYQNRAVDENRPLLEEAISLRAEIADLLGYADWAAYSMEPKMADPASVAALYASIVPGLTELGRRERAALEALLEADEPGARLEQWDWRYYHDLQRRRVYGIDQNEVAEYFPLDAVIEGMFEVTGSVLGLSYVPLPAEPTWHEDVRSYRIHDADSGEAIATFHLDLHPREGKYTHAACWNPVVRRRKPDGSVRQPVAAVAANFTRPTADTPSLLTHDEAETLWHEFGHALHACLTEVDEQTFAGSETEWDFVEAPSQIMENWMWEAEVLQRFARHYRSGAPIPADRVAALVAGRDQNVGLQTLRQVSLGQYDLLMHTSGSEPDLDALLVTATDYSLLPHQPDTFMAASWGHPMGGYDAGYYTYLWSKVYGDDMYSVFEAGGIMSPEVGRRYRREVLATGGARDAIEHLRAFLGREPNADAFLARLGLEGARD
jgi:thimet oligopeptidase